MKNIIHTVILFYLALYSRLFPYRLKKKIFMYQRYYHSILLRREFKRVGTPFSIEPPYSINGAQNISIGNNFSSFARLRLDAVETYEGIEYKPEIIIGNNVSCNYDCHIGCVNKIVIGSNVLLASRVFITDHFHGQITQEQLAIPPAQRKLYSKGPVIIEDNVWIGESVSIMPGVTIGKNAVIGANSVVTKDVPSNAVVGGVPAQILKQL
jgi:acetyltransferase-like isoleucine patch superfamily enzyme